MDQIDIDFINEQGITTLDGSVRELENTYEEIIPPQYIPEIGSMLTIDVTDDLTSVDPMNTTLVYVRGRLDKSDGYGGVFIYDPLQSGSNDNGINFDGWIRQYDDVVNLKWFGAKGDDGDDTLAITKAGPASAGKRLFIPDGIYTTKEELKIASNSSVFGESKYGTIIKLHDDALNGVNGITNISNDGTIANTGDHDIEISTLSVDGNYARGDNGGSSASGISFASVINGKIDNVFVKEGRMHGIDIGPAGYTTSGSIGKRSENILITNCDVQDTVIDDGITTHFCDNVVIEKCNVIWTGAIPMYSSFQHGIEIDDGSQGIVVSNCYTKGWYEGIQIKGHIPDIAAYNVTVENCVMDECHCGIRIRDGGTTTGTLASNVKILGCTIRNNADMTQFGGTRYHFLINNYRNVTINDLTIINEPGFNVSAFSALGSGAENVSISNVKYENVISLNPQTLGLIHSYSDIGNNISIKDILTSNCNTTVITISTSARTIRVSDIMTYFKTPPEVKNKAILQMYKTGLYNGNTKVKNLVDIGGGYDAIIGELGYTDINDPNRIELIETEHNQVEMNTRKTFWTAGESGLSSEGMKRTPQLTLGWFLGTTNIRAGESAGISFASKIKSQDPVENAGIYVIKASETDSNQSADMYFSLRDNLIGYRDIWRMRAAGDFLPVVSDTVDVGSPSFLVQSIFLANSPIVSSDEREKKGIVSLSDTEKIVALEIKSNIKKFVRKNDTKEKERFGVIAQEVESIFSKHGLDVSNYNLMSAELGEDGNTVYGILYEELLIFILGAI